MIKILLKILPYNFFRRFGWPKVLPMNLTIGVTSFCNSRCLTCNIWRKKDRIGELTFEEWDKIFKNLGKSIVYLTISGGEPFLRKDIVQICQSAYRHCRPLMVTIPTNCLLPKVVIESVKRITQTCPQTQFILNLSVDGIGLEDDRIRGVPGHYQKMLEVFKALKKTKRKNLTLGLHTVISRFNVKHFPEIAESLLKLKPDSYVTEIAEQREELGTIQKKIAPSADDYQKVIDFLLVKLKNEKITGFGRITRAFRKQYYFLVKRFLLEKKQIIPCYAGWASAQIAANGDVWGCCIKADVFGNLKKVGYDLKKIWFSSKAEKLRKFTKAGKCSCPLANAAYTNMLLNLKTLIKVGYNFFL